MIAGYATNITPVPDYYGTGDVPGAYDPDKVGWKYDEIPCEVQSATNPSVSPYVNCTPSSADQQDPLAEQILAGLYSNLLLAWNIFFPPPLMPAQMEDRKIFNTWMFAQGNEGHEFNAVLTDDRQRRRCQPRLAPEASFPVAKSEPRCACWLRIVPAKVPIGQ